MTKEQFLKNYNLTEDQFSGKYEISGYLDLRSLTSIPEGFNPTVGDDLYLSSLTSIPEGFNPTVGGYLVWDKGNKRKHIGSPIQRPLVQINKNFFWDKNDKRYAKIDGMFCEIIGERDYETSVELSGKNLSFKIYAAKKVNKNGQFFIANKDSFYAHGEDLKKAVSDLQFKMIAEKLKKEPIKEDTIITDQYYRIITGACEMGVKNWKKENGITRDEITAKELLPILKKTNAYGFDRFKQLVTF